MMKHFYRSLLAVAVAGVALFSSCSDEKETALNIEDIKGSAVVKGKVVSEIGRSSSTSPILYPAASGLTLYFYLDTESLNNSNTGHKVFTTTTDSSGEFTITLPATTIGLDYTIHANSFEEKRWVADINNPGNYIQEDYFFTNNDLTNFTLIENIGQYHYIVLDDYEKIQ